MSSVYDFYKRKMNIPSSSGHTNLTLGDKLKSDSDKVMELTWNNDIQAKRCYIYDYLHDDQPEKNIGMTYENTTKTAIDAKILISTYGSISKDLPTLQCQFKPSQKENFTEDDELFYMETYRKKYHLDDIFVGMYLDVPDKKGVYHRHMICMKDVEQNFQKYFILPCDHKLQWIQQKGENRYKRNMWCVLRTQSSYNSGIWTDRYFSDQQNQELLFLPTNDVSDTITYISEKNDKNQRIILDVPNYSIDNWTPNTWIVSKVERINIKGRTKLTLYQTPFNSHVDYIEKDNNGIIVGMWANYFDSNISPSDPDDISTPLPSPGTNVIADITASSYSIKVGGTYKTITLNLSDDSNDITKDFEEAQFEWRFLVGSIDIKNFIIKKDISFNKLKIKFIDDPKYIGEIMTISCEIFREDIGYIYSNKCQIEITS